MKGPDMIISHNSALFPYRNPQGALKTGESVLLRVRVEAENLQSVRIEFFIQDASTVYAMSQAEDGWWEYRFSYPEATVAWYRFQAEDGGRLWYGGPAWGVTQGDCMVYDNPCNSFQLTVYDASFQVPAWFQKSTMYQIFPDRFKRGDIRNLEEGKAQHEKMGRKVVVHEKWGEQPLYEPLPGEQYYAPCDFFGGDLRGIIQSLDYFKSLGVDVLYLNPIVEAASNHRYDTADYMRVDPILGNNADFAELCKKAAKHGIRVMLDGVYSHTGSDSRYFNRLGNYDSLGAFQGSKSPFYKWYTFYGTKYNYRSWWGFDTLPEVNEMDESWQRYVITGKHSVFRNWLHLGAKGFRLDVADELPDEVIELMRLHLKRHDKENVLLGEVWEDATTKRSYGANRRYALGKGLDSVMNYPFKAAVTGFLQGEKNAYELVNFLTSQQLNYPRPMHYALMNLVSSHDEPRLRTVLATGKTGDGMSREEQAKLRVTEKQDHEGAVLQRLAGILQYVIPGVPSLYYGDEYGLHGLKDPFNRGPFVKRDPDTCVFFKMVGSLRKQLPALQSGHTSYLTLDMDCLAVLRFILDGKDAFGAPATNNTVLTLVNRSEEDRVFDLSLLSFEYGLGADEWNQWRAASFHKAVDLISREKISARKGSFQAKVPARSFRIFKLK